MLAKNAERPGIAGPRCVGLLSKLYMAVARPCVHQCTLCTCLMQVPRPPPAPGSLRPLIRLAAAKGSPGDPQPSPSQPQQHEGSPGAAGPLWSVLDESAGTGRAAQTQGTREADRPAEATAGPQSEKPEGAYSLPVRCVCAHVMRFKLDHAGIQGGFGCKGVEEPQAGTL